MSPRWQAYTEPQTATAFPRAAETLRSVAPTSAPRLGPLLSELQQTVAGRRSALAPLAPTAAQVQEAELCPAHAADDFSWTLTAAPAKTRAVWWY